MPTPPTPAPKSLREQVGDCIQEVTKLRDFVRNVMQRLGETMTAVGDMVQKLQQEGRAVAVTLEAVSGILGQDVVNTKVDEIVRRQAEDRLAVALAEGRVELIDEVGPGTITVGRLFDKEGQLVRPGRFESAFDTQDDAGKEAFQGKRVGGEVVDEGERFVVDAVYRVVPPKPAEVTEGVSAGTPDAS